MHHPFSPHLSPVTESQTLPFTFCCPPDDISPVITSAIHSPPHLRPRNQFLFIPGTRTPRNGTRLETSRQFRPRVTRLSPEVAVSRAGQHSSVILPIIYFHPLKRPRLRLQSGLPTALPFNLGISRAPTFRRYVRHSSFQRVHSRARGHSFGARPLIERAAFQAARVTDTHRPPSGVKRRKKKKENARG